MGTQRNQNLNVMLREFAHSGIVEDAFSKDNYLWGKLKKNRGWKDGVEMQIPIELSENSDLAFGQLIDENDIGEGSYEKIRLTNQPQLFSSMIIEERDLKVFSDMKDSFLKFMPKKMNQLTRRMKHAYSTMILRGGMLAKPTADGTAAGVLAVDKPQYFTLDQRVLLRDTVTGTNVIAYIAGINMNSREVSFKNARGAAGTPVDISGTGTEVTAASGGVYLPGADTEKFTSFVDYLLPASLGGSDSLYGVIDKASNPIVAPQVFDGGAGGLNITASTVVDKLIDVYYDVKELGKCEQTELLVPYHIFKAFAKKVEISKRYDKTNSHAGVGYSSLEIAGPNGKMVITALADMRDDLIFGIDWDQFEFAGHRFLDRIKTPDGLEYHTVRKGTGYRFICDHVLQGDLICSGKLSSSMVIHSVPKL